MWENLFSFLLVFLASFDVAYPSHLLHNSIGCSPPLNSIEVLNAACIAIGEKRFIRVRIFQLKN